MMLPFSAQTNQPSGTFTAEIKNKSDKAVNYFLFGFFITGLILASFYDTWNVAIGIGGLSLLAYYSAKIALPNSNIYQYVLGAVLGIFMAQYIYQMHGMFEMHFIAFIASAMLITYQNWKLQLPLALVVIIHHGIFGYIQYTGYNKVYFTQLDYMNLETFMIHITLATVVFFICGLWAYHFKKFSEAHISQSFEIGKLEEEKLQQKALFEMSHKLKITNERLEEANNELNKLFNSVDEVLFSVDMKGHKITQMSSACEKVYGYTAAEFYTDLYLWTKLVHPDDNAILERQLVGMNSGKEIRSQYRIIHKDGSIHWLEHTIIPTMDENGILTRLDGVTRDITRSKEAEAEIKALNESLEIKVKERTAELQQVNSELEAFSYTVSHDLRAPLRIINGYGKMLLNKSKDKLEQEGQQMIIDIMGNAAQMGRLIDDLLNFSRMGRAQLSMLPVDMKDGVQTVVKELKNVETYRSAEIKIHDLGTSACDPTLMKQVWSNLISNALKYSGKKDKPLVEIGSEKRNGVLTYYVKDNGAGFDMEHYSKLFGVFQRLHKVTEYEGTGVGLAIVHRIITRHGGKIWADAKVDEGATFYFTLPK